MEEDSRGQQGSRASESVAATVPARAMLVGYPSAAYGGRVLSVAVANHGATVVASPADELRISPGPDDRRDWRSLDHLAEKVLRYGYGTGVQLLEAALIGFARWRSELGDPLPAVGLELSYDTDIPRQVGLGGSTAIVIAAQEALAGFYGVEVPVDLRPAVAFRAESEELGLPAILADAVAQVRGGVTAMDFAPDRIATDDGLDVGRYEALDPTALPHLFLAYLERPAGPAVERTDDLDERFAQGDRMTIDGLRRLSSLAAEAHAALRWHNTSRLGELIDISFDVHSSIAEIPSAVVDLVDAARELDAGATSAGGRGTAIVGTYDDATHLASIADRLSAFGAIAVGLEVAENRQPLAAGSQSELGG